MRHRNYVAQDPHAPHRQPFVDLAPSNVVAGEFVSPSMKIRPPPPPPLPLLQRRSQSSTAKNHSVTKRARNTSRPVISGTIGPILAALTATAVNLCTNVVVAIVWLTGALTATVILVKVIDVVHAERGTYTHVAEIRHATARLTRERQRRRRSFVAERKGGSEPTWMRMIAVSERIWWLS